MLFKKIHEDHTVDVLFKLYNRKRRENKLKKEENTTEKEMSEVTKKTFFGIIGRETPKKDTLENAIHNSFDDYHDFVTIDLREEPEKCVLSFREYLFKERGILLSKEELTKIFWSAIHHKVSDEGEPGAEIAHGLFVSFAKRGRELVEEAILASTNEELLTLFDREQNNGYDNYEKKTIDSIDSFIGPVEPKYSISEESRKKVVKNLIR